MRLGKNPAQNIGEMLPVGVNSARLGGPRIRLSLRQISIVPMPVLIPVKGESTDLRQTEAT